MLETRSKTKCVNKSSSLCGAVVVAATFVVIAVVIVGSMMFTVRATKKGNVPIVVESRKHHKVIVLSNIEGDGAQLLSLLKKKLGTGGVLRTNNTENGGRSDSCCRIEINGENKKHIETIQRYICLEAKCLIGASKQTKEAIEITDKNTNKNTNKNKTDGATATTTNTIRTKQAIQIAPSLTSKAIKTMKPIQLKAQLAARQLSTQGNKKELIARLVGVISSSSSSIIITPTLATTP